MGDLNGKTVIDTTNSIRARPEPHATGYHAIKAITGTTSVVKCFNSTGFENMRNPIYKGEGIDMFMAGNDAAAKQVATLLSADLGFGHCYDFGGDDRMELLEKLALSWINLAIKQGHGRDLAFRIVKRYAMMKASLRFLLVPESWHGQRSSSMNRRFACLRQYCQYFGRVNFHY